jgi:hypothetical protein
MQLTQSGGQTATGPQDWFTGTAYIDGIRNPDGQSAVGCAHVRFTPGARTAWHTHPKAKPSTSPTASGTSPDEAVRSRRSVLATSSTSNRTKNTGMEPPRTGSWHTSPSKKPTPRARW